MVVLLYHYRLPGTVPVQYDTVYYVLLITRVLYCVLSLYRTSTVQVPYKYRTSTSIIQKWKNDKNNLFHVLMYTQTYLAERGGGGGGGGAGGEKMTAHPRQCLRRTPDRRRRAPRYPGRRLEQVLLQQRFPQQITPLIQHVEGTVFASRDLIGL